MSRTTLWNLTSQSIASLPWLTRWLAQCASIFLILYIVAGLTFPTNETVYLLRVILRNAITFVGALIILVPIGMGLDPRETPVLASKTERPRLEGGATNKDIDGQEGRFLIPKVTEIPLHIRLMGFGTVAVLLLGGLFYLIVVLGGLFHLIVVRHPEIQEPLALLSTGLLGFIALVVGPFLKRPSTPSEQPTQPVSHNRTALGKRDNQNGGMQ